MSLINCPECGKTFSDKASACPNCGCPIEAIICADEPKKAQVNNQKNIPYSLSVKEIIKRADVFFKTKDYAGAFPLYKQAAELGNASAQVAVGNYFLNGWQPVKPDYKIAKEWFEKAADRNNAVAWNQLGSMYSSGKGVPVDKKKALDCFEKAASFGHALAASNAGVMYHMGSGTEVNYKKAFDYYNKALNANVSQGVLYNNLGVLYLEGKGTEKNYAKAELYLEKAQSLGFEMATTNLEALKKAKKADPEEQFKKRKGIPSKCPVCGSIDGWVNLGHSRQGYSIYKAAIPTLILGSVGLVAGALGHHSLTYRCSNCGYEKIYDVDLL